MPLSTVAALTALAVAALLAVLDAMFPLPDALLVASRWAAIAAIVVFAVRRRSLTTWILVNMVVGAEVGHDWPTLGTDLRFLSQLFLRLIRTIVAPLIFATLVVGIALLIRHYV